MGETNLYQYCLNNPLMKCDSNGYFGIRLDTMYSDNGGNSEQIALWLTYGTIWTKQEAEAVTKSLGIYRNDQVFNDFLYINEPRWYGPSVYINLNTDQARDFILGHNFVSGVSWYILLKVFKLPLVPELVFFIQQYNTYTTLKNSFDGKYKNGIKINFSILSLCISPLIWMDYEPIDK